jgi:hypothetical protein
VEVLKVVEGWMGKNKRAILNFFTQNNIAVQFMLHEVKTLFKILST